MLHQYVCYDKSIHLVMALIILVTVRADVKESRDSSSKLKSKHKPSDPSSDGERPHKESRHESHDRDRSQTETEKAQERMERVQHRDEKRNDTRTTADKVHDADARVKDDRGDNDRGHRAAERDQLSADETANRSGDGHRRSAETAAGKPADERGTNNLRVVCVIRY